MQGGDLSTKWTWPIVGAAVLVGLGLRIWMADGALWLDEAWSAVFADRVPPLTGVFTHIHHDNNHPLNTLWLQLVGIDAPPLLQRGLSILTSTAAIGVAALIGVRQSRWSAVAMAWLFALSPFFVLYGSEARGYAPATLAILLAIWVVERWRDGGASPARPLVWIALFGTLAHLVMIPALLLIAGWAVVVERKRGAKQLAMTFAPALIVTGGVAAMLLGLAWRAQGGMTVGSYEVFSWGGFEGALDELVLLTCHYWAIFMLLVFAMMAAPKAEKIVINAPAWLSALLIIAMPLAVAISQPGNSHYARYYLITSIGLLLWIGMWFGRAVILESRRLPILTVLLPVLILSAAGIDILHEEGRGRIDAAITAMQVAKPQSARVVIIEPRGEAPLRVAAGQAGYRLSIAVKDCANADFLFVTRKAGDRDPAMSNWCGRRWSRVTGRDVSGPSGQSWSLYRALQSPNPVANGPPLPGDGLAAP